MTRYGGSYASKGDSVYHYIKDVRILLQNEEPTGKVFAICRQKLDPPVVEYVMRDTDMDVDPMINHTHIYAMKVATPEEMAQIDSTCLKVNEVLTAYLKEINIELIDFKLQFGRYHGRIIVADEITPDTARFWDSSTHEPLDKDRFRRDMDNVAEAYQEVLHRMIGAS